MILQGKCALVTGGSRGIGRAIVLAFLKEGASVYYLSRTEGDSPEALREAAAEGGGQVHFKRCDIGDENALTEAVNAVLSESGGLDLLVNNAGMARDGLIFRISTADWNEVIQTNLTSAFIACRAVAAQMIKRRSGSIINISSIVGLVGNGGQTNYAASKAGLIGFTKSLAREVASRSVRVNAIAPGYIDTLMTEKVADKQKEAMLAQIPMGRVGLPAEVAKAALFLASDLSTYVTGQVIQVDGGLAM